jgi:dTDP-4-amino-4,6-dideoxy-D-glucose transaminase
MEPYKSLEAPRLPLTHTENLAERVLTLPTGTSVSEPDIEIVCRLVAMSREHATEINKALDEADRRVRRAGVP